MAHPQIVAIGPLPLVYGRIVMQSFELIYGCGSSHDVLSFWILVEIEHVATKSSFLLTIIELDSQTRIVAIQSFRRVYDLRFMLWR